ncbi:2-phospho-L-lactate guanylyltransferase [Streptomyces sp. NPDC058372]|uniref:2-phospho-L-lactate guanylyltransferase n=1 Tax=unclassified Streptomyces TaxID=2593676 RepID=UPI00365EF0CC
MTRMRTEPDAGGSAGWSLVVPLKPLALAKSRLAPALDGPARARLALAFAQDTVAAALACSAVRDVVVVTDDARAGGALAALGARVTGDAPAAGLNAALAHGARTVRAARPRAALAALNADLPALRPGELARVLAAAAAHPRAFLADAAGIGTTFLSAAPGAPFTPCFGGPSRARHTAAGAVELAPDAVPGVRRDVDTPADLHAARELGPGPHTAAVLASLRDTTAPAPRASSAPPG